MACISGVQPLTPHAWLGSAPPRVAPDRAALTRRRSGCRPQRPRSLAAAKQRDFFFFERPAFSHLQISDAHWPDFGSHQLQRLAAHRLEHTAYLPVPAFSDRYFQMRVFGGIPQPFDDCGLCRPVAKSDAVLQPVKLLVVQARGCLYLISLRDLVVRVGEPFREL